MATASTQARVAAGKPQTPSGVRRSRGPAKPTLAPRRDAKMTVPEAAAGDDRLITATDLAPVPLTPEMTAYFAKCEEKLGFVPNVLKVYAFDMAKLGAFVAMYND